MKWKYFEKDIYQLINYTDQIEVLKTASSDQH